MTKQVVRHAMGLGWTVVLASTMWLCAGAAPAAAQAAAAAAGLNAMSASTATSAGRSTGQALRGALSQAGAAVQVSGSANNAATTAGTKGASGAGANGSTGAEAKGSITPATVSSLLRFTPPVDLTETHGVPVNGPMPNIHFDTVSFEPCSGEMGSTKVDLPMDGDYVAYHCQPVFRIIYFAYEGSTAGPLTLGGFPEWVEQDLYNFEAKVAPEDVAAWQKLGLYERRAAVRSLLANVLKLKIKANTTPRNVYLLSVAEDGARLKAYSNGEQERLPNGLMLTGKDMSWVGRVAYFQGVSMEVLADSLSAHLDRKVVDRTGLTGSYDFALPLPYGSGASASAPLGESIPSVEEELAGLGLKLEAAKVDDGELVVQHIERPMEQSAASNR